MGSVDRPQVAAGTMGSTQPTLIGHRMTGISPTALLPILIMLVVLAVDAWVYADARKRLQEGDRVTISAGSLRVATPEAWFLGCLILWVVFFPLYLTAT